MKTKKIETKQPDRLQSLDVLRGFDMFWIVGGGSLIVALAATLKWGWLDVVAEQLEHVPWAGFHFEDLIFPLFMFISGVAIPYAITAKVELGANRKDLFKKIVKRGLLLVVLGIIYNGALKNGFENMRVLLNEFSSNAVVIVYQDTPLMISETCVFASEKCSYPDACGAPRTKARDASISGGTRWGFTQRPGKFREELFDSSHGNNIRVISRNCRSIVLNRRPFCLAAHLKELALAGAINLRADFMHRGYSENEMMDVWQKLRSGALIPSGHNANFKRGID